MGTNVECDTCALVDDEDYMGLCNVCGNNVCGECDVGTIKSGWICPDCKDFL